MRWNKKYKKFTLASFLLGGHFNPKVLYLTYKAEQLINYELFKKINKKFENNKSDYTKYLGCSMSSCQSILLRKNVKFT